MEQKPPRYGLGWMLVGAALVIFGVAYKPVVLLGALLLVVGALLYARTRQVKRS